MTTAIIIDDEEINRKTLSKMLDLFIPDVEVVGLAESADEGLNLIESKHPDIVFLDIEMPEKTGFDMLKEIKNPTFQIIFTTAHAEYAIKAIKFAALDYLLKPINLNELKIAVEKAIKAFKNGDNISGKIDIVKANKPNAQFEFNKIALPTLEGIEFYNTEDIIRVEADRAYCKFYLKKGKEILVSKSLKEYEDILEECNFYRTHKSHMVNLSTITKYVKGKGGYVVLEDGSHVDVSVRRKDELISLLAKK